MFELGFLNNLLDLQVKQNEEYNLIYLEHEQKLLRRDEKIQNLDF